jgi:hypothetical protein
MIFIFHVVIALALVATGALVSLLSSPEAQLGRISFLAGVVLAQFWLFGSALMLRSRRVRHFDMIVASELLIALGIFSLITGIVVSGFVALHNVNTLTGAPWQLLQVVLFPFGEGLFGSGLAPLLASVLRQVEVLRYGSGDTAATDGDIDLPGLAAKIRETINALDDFASAWKRSEVILAGASSTLATSADIYARAAQNVEKALIALAADIEKSSASGAKTIDIVFSEFSKGVGISGSRVARELGTGGDSINESLGRAAKGFDGILDRAGTRFDELNKKTNTAASTLNELSIKTRAFSDATTDGTTLLIGLQKLIESVTNFVRPGDSRSP